MEPGALGAPLDCGPPWLGAGRRQGGGGAARGTADRAAFVLRGMEAGSLISVETENKAILSWLPPRWDPAPPGSPGHGIFSETPPDTPPEHPLAPGIGV